MSRQTPRRVEGSEFLGERAGDMKASKDGYFTRAFVMTPGDLERLVKVIEDYAAIRYLKVSCADEVDREFPSVDELLKFENPPKKSIKALRIFTAPRGDMTSLTLRFDTDSMRNIYYSVEGEESAVLDFMEQLEERLSGMRPWYALAADTGYRGLLLPFLVGMVTVSLILQIGVRAAVSLGLMSEKPDSYAPLVVAGIALTLIGMYSQQIILNIRKAFFPNGMFAIGQGAKRYKDADIIRQAIIVGFAIEILGGITLAFFI